MSNSNNQIKTGAILNYIILGLNALVGLTYMPYMLRMLGPSEYGIYSLAASVIAYLSMLDLGFGNAVIRYTAKYKAENRTEDQYNLFGLFTILYSCIGVATLAIGLILYSNVDNMFGETLTPIEVERTKTIILLMIFNLAVTFPLSIYGAIITAYEKFIFLRVIQILRILLSTAVMIVLLYYGHKAITMVIVQTIFNVVTLGLNFFYCRNKIKIRINFGHFDKKLLKEVSIYSFWIFLNLIMDKIYWSTGQFILGAFVGTTAIAIFGVAIQLESIYMSFSTAISGVLLPRVTAMVSQGDNKKAVSDLFIKTGRIQYIVLVYILTGFILFGKQFIILWAGEDYVESYPIALIFFISLTAPLIQNTGIAILQARNQMKFRSILYVAISIMSLILQIVLAKKYGGMGCAIAISISLFIGQVLIINIYYNKVQDLQILCFWKEIAKMSIIPIIAILILYPCVKHYPITGVNELLVAIATFTVIYLPLFWKFSMNDYERALLKKPFYNRKKYLK